MSKLERLAAAAGGNVDESMALRGAPITAATSTPPARWQGVVKSRDVAEVPVAKIVRDETQPREEFESEALERLAGSIRRRGVLQPIRARWDEGRGAYIVIAGERRWRAATMAGLETIPCVLAEGPIDSAELLAVQLVENALREDLRPVEAARAYRRLMDGHGWSARQVAQELHLDHSTIVKALALLELPPTVQEAVEHGGITASAAYEVSKLEGPELQVQVAQAVADQGLSRAEVSELVGAIKARRPAPAAKPEPLQLDLGDGMALKLTWKKANGVDPVKALKIALRILQEQARRDEAA
jgi:ParB family chromosome partitioning protein